MKVISMSRPMMPSRAAKCARASYGYWLAAPRLRMACTALQGHNWKQYLLNWIPYHALLLAAPQTANGHPQGSSGSYARSKPQQPRASQAVRLKTRETTDSSV